MPTSPGTHPSDDDLELHSMGRLSESEAETVEQHLLICAECRARLEEADEYVVSMRHALQEVAKDTGQDPGGASRKPPKKWIGHVRAVPKPVWGGLAVAAAFIGLLAPMGDSPGEPFATRLETLRGTAADVGPVVPSGRPLSLTADVSGLPALEAYAVRIVDARGAAVADFNVSVGAGTALLDLETGLEAGQYWVRIHAPAASDNTRGELLREFGLKVE